MIRALVFIVIVFAAALGFAWLADRPGTVDIVWLGYEIRLSVMTATIAVLAIFFLLLIAWNLAAAVLHSPAAATHYIRGRRNRKGYSALSRSILALTAGDAARGAHLGQEAARYLKNEPAAAVLIAQAAQASGNRAKAEAHYAALLENKQTQPVALHGLFVGAEQHGDGKAARAYAQQAFDLAPHLTWAAEAHIGYQALDGDWEGALETLEKNVANKVIDRQAFLRQRAALLTARAQELEESDPERALVLATEADRLAPDLVPAAVLAARLSAKRGEVRKATKILETAWKALPHPDLAEAYTHARAGDSALDRLKRAETLAKLRPNHPQGALTLTRAHLDMRDFARARAALEPLTHGAPTQTVCMMMAELEDAETGDEGRMREWLARAVRATEDPAWIADGIVSRVWAPVSPVTGRIDAFEWRTPASLSPGGLLIEHHHPPAAKPAAGAVVAPTHDAASQQALVAAGDAAPGTGHTVAKLPSHGERPTLT